MSRWYCSCKRKSRSLYGKLVGMLIWNGCPPGKSEASLGSPEVFHRLCGLLEPSVKKWGSPRHSFLCMWPEPRICSVHVEVCLTYAPPSNSHGSTGLFLVSLLHLENSPVSGQHQAEVPSVPQLFSPHFCSGHPLWGKASLCPQHLIGSPRMGCPSPQFQGLCPPSLGLRTKANTAS